MCNSVFVILIVAVAVEGARHHLHGGQRAECEKIRIPACQGLGYNHTTMPNWFHHRTQAQAQEVMDLFDLRLHFNCSPHLRFFLCSVFTPMCSEHVPSGPIPACRSHCERVRKDCEHLLQWPAELDCSKFPEPPNICMHMPDNEEGMENQNHHQQQPLHYQTDIRLPSHMMSCPEKPTYTDEETKLAEKWSTGWGWICFISTLFTLFTWTVEPPRYKYPERPVIFIALCYNLQGLIYILRGALGPPASYAACLTSSVLLYYTSLAAMSWWLAFVLAWWLSAARDWSSEALTSDLAPRLHLNCWGGPLLVTGGVFLGNIPHEASLGGPCELQSALPILLPHSVLLLCICVLSVLTGMALFRVRRTLRSSGRSAGKLERLMTRLAIYFVLYVLPSFGWLMCLAYDAYKPASVAPDCNQSGVEIVLIRVFFFLNIGSVSGMWVWSSKTCKTWSRILAGAPKKPRRPMPVSRV